jgi:hypothetical protein
MRRMSARPQLLAATGLAWLTAAGCPAPEAPPEPPKTVAEAPASQPASGPSSLPAGHSTSTTPVSLEALFRVPEVPGGVAIKVGDTPIGVDVLETRLRTLQVQITGVGDVSNITRKEVLKAAVDQLVEEQLLPRVAADLGVKPDPKIAEGWLADMEKRIAEDPAFAAFLSRAGNTLEQRKKDAAQSALVFAIQDHLEAGMRARTATTVAAYYERRKDDFKVHPGVEAWRIVVRAPATMVQRDRDAARARAERVFAEAKKKDTNFENLARLHSEGGKGPQGGYLGFVAPGTLEKELEAALFAARPGTVLPLREDAAGFTIYKVGKRREGGVRPLAEVKDEIFSRLYKSLMRREIAKEMHKLKQKHEVQILIPEFQP